MVGAILAHNYLVWWAAQLVAILFLVLLFLRWRPGFLGGRTIGETLGAALNARENAIKEQLEAAQRSREEAAKIREQSARDVEAARLQAEEIVSRASETSAAIGREIEERSREEYARIVAQAKTEIEFERQRAELALRRRAADVVIDAASQIVRQNLDPASDRRIIDESLGTMGRHS